MYVIGLTGGLGAGKSTVAEMFAQHGARVIDADAITRHLLTQDKKCIKKVAKIFPDVILSSKVNRLKLARIVFSHPRALKKLTNILYPEALKEVKFKISRYKRGHLIVLDVPLLFESQWNKITDITIVVVATRRQQIERAQKRLGLNKADIGCRLKNQMSTRQKKDLADMIIDNRRGLLQTRQQVDAIVNRLESRGIIKRGTKRRNKHDKK